MLNNLLKSISAKKQLLRLFAGCCITVVALLVVTDFTLYRTNGFAQLTEANHFLIDLKIRNSTTRTFSGEKGNGQSELSFSTSANSNDRADFNFNRTYVEYLFSEHTNMTPYQRIEHQLDLVQRYAKDLKNRNILLKDKRFLLMNGFSRSPVHTQEGYTEFQGCPISACKFVGEKQGYSKKVDEFDVLWWDNYAFAPQITNRNQSQIWVMVEYESPYHSGSFRSIRHNVNYTATYRSDSSVPLFYRFYIPDGNLTLYDRSVNYAARKTKKVAWLVSNRADRNGRMKYAQELSKYIDVDIYGAITGKSCGRLCLEMLRKDYKVLACIYFNYHSRLQHFG